MAANESDLRDAAGVMRRPYAATANVVAALHRARTRNLPDVIDDEFYRLVQIPDVVFGRVTEAMRFLDMIGEDGRPTDRLQSLAASSDEEFRELLAAAIRAAYREDFERVDPSQDTHAQIVNAFRRYQPRSQTSRMVMLFLGLCREAGIPVLDAPRDRAMRQPTPRSRTTPAPSERPNRKRIRNSDSGQKPTDSTSVLFGITDDDIAALEDGEFEEVWSALGKVARARGRASRQQKESPQPDRTGEEGGNS